MARVESYIIDRILSGKEFFLGTDVDNGNVTRSYVLQEIAEFIANGGGSGLDGLNGTDGIPNGNGTFTWQKFGIDNVGSGITDIATPETLYIGLAWNKKSFIESDKAEDYEWFLISDKDIYWVDADGNKHYTWLKYSENITIPYNFSDQAVGMKYMGLGLDKLTPEPDQSELTDQQWYDALSWSEILSGNPIAGTNKFFWFKFGEDTSGSGISDYVVGKTHIGIAYDQDDYIPSANPSDYNWGSLTGDNIDSEGEFTHLKFSNTPSEEISDSPINIQYIGFNFDNATNVESEDYTVYKWVIIPSSGGGIIDNKKKWTWIKFSAFSNGFDTLDAVSIQDDPTGMGYIGIAINQDLATESDDPNVYFWDSISGAQSYTGPNGETLWIHTKYSAYIDGFDTSGDPAMDDLPGANTYMGISYNNTSTVESEDPNDYEWQTFKSGGFLQQPSWVFQWIKYGNKDESGNIIDISDSPAGKTWMGIGHDKLVPEESTDPDDYVWNPLTGAQSYIGPNGETLWIWVKYSYDNPSTNLYSDPNEVEPKVRWMGLAFNKDSSDMTNVWTDYTWYQVDFEDDINGNGSDSDHDQNNKVRVINIPLAEVHPVTTASIVAYLRKQVFEVSQHENLIFNIVDGDVTTEPEDTLLDQSVSLILGEDDTVVRGETTITLKWDPQTETKIKEYKLSVTPLGGTTVVYNNLDSSTITKALTGLTKGGVYTAIIEGFGESNEDIKTSNPFTFEMAYEDAVPSLELLNKTETTATVRFLIDPSFEASYFRVYSVGSPDAVIGEFQAVDGNTGVITGLNPSTTYYTYIKAFTSLDVESSKSVPDVEIQTLAEANPDLIQIPTISLNDRKMNSLDISVATNDLVEYGRVDSFVFEYKRFNGSGFTWDGASLLTFDSSIKADFKTAPYLKILNLDAGQTYNVRLRFKSGSKHSVYSNELKVSTRPEVYTSLTFRDSPFGIGNTSTGHLYIYNGKPNTEVKVNVGFYILKPNLQYATGSLRFVNENIVINSSGGSGVSSKIAVTLDENGEFFDLFNITSSVSGVAFVDATITGSEYPADPITGSDNIKYTTIA